MEGKLRADEEAIVLEKRGITVLIVPERQTDGSEESIEKSRLYYCLLMIDG